MFPATHLMLNECRVVASSEWRCTTDAWLLVRLSSGLGYWCDQTKGYREVSQDDSLLLFPSAQGGVLASRVCDVHLQVFAIELQLLSGVLTVNECRALTVFAQANREKVMLLPRYHAFSVRFAEICRNQRPNTLLSRLKLLQLFAELLGEGLQAHAAVEPNRIDGRGRLHQMIRQIPEGELMRCSVQDLARRMCCSQRHFSRLFHDEIGMSLRDKQQQLRLDRARHLLEHGTDKIVNVALEVGYQSLSLFNVMFKKRFQMTPSQWRFQARRGKRQTGNARLAPGAIPTVNSSSHAKDEAINMPASHHPHRVAGSALPAPNG